MAGNRTADAARANGKRRLPVMLSHERVQIGVILGIDDEDRLLVSLEEFSNRQRIIHAPTDDLAVAGKSFLIGNGRRNDDFAMTESGHKGGTFRRHMALQAGVDLFQEDLRRGGKKCAGCKLHSLHGFLLRQCPRIRVDHDNFGATCERLRYGIDIDRDGDGEAGLDKGRACIERAGQVVGYDRNLQPHASAPVLTA